MIGLRSRPRWRALRHRRPFTDNAGLGLVEFALILPILLMVTVGTFDLALAVWQTNTLADAAREATRYAIVHGDGSSAPVGPGASSYTAPDQDTVLTGIVRDRAVGLTGVSVSSTWPDGTNARGKRVSVVATVAYAPVLSQAFLGSALRVTLRGQSELVIHR